MGRNGVTVLTVQVTSDGDTYICKDFDENIGPWLARVWSLTPHGPASRFEVRIVGCVRL